MYDKIKYDKQAKKPNQENVQSAHCQAIHVLIIYLFPIDGPNVLFYFSISFAMKLCIVVLLITNTETTKERKKWQGDRNSIANYCGRTQTIGKLRHVVYRF